jgi:hypothetical protein
MEESEEQKRINAEVQRQVNEALQEYAKILANASAGITNLTGKVNTASQSSAKQAEATGKSIAYQEAYNKSLEDNNKAMANLSAATQSAVIGAKQLGTAFLSTEQGFSKFGKALESAGDAAFSLGKMIGGPLGIAVGALLKGATMAAEAALKQADNTLKATDSLSKLGGAGSFTAAQVLDMGHKAGLTSGNLEVMTKAAGKANTGLAGLGSTVDGGIKAFGDMVAVSKEQRMAFQRMGVSQEELMNQQADYVKLQEISGVNLADQAKTGKNLKAASLEYAENLLRLSALTGKSADDLTKEKMIANEVYEEQIQTQMEQAKIRQLREGGFKDEADDLQRQQDNRKRAAEEYVHTFGKEQGLQMARAVRTGSFDKSTAGLATIGFDPAAEKRKLEEAKSKQEVDKITAATKNDMVEKRQTMLLNMGTAVQYGGEKLGKAVGLGSSETAQAYARMGSRDNQAANTAATNKTAGVAEGAPGAGGVTATDPAQEARNALTEAEIAAKVKLDEMVAAMNPLLNGFNTTTTAATALTAAAVLAAGALSAMALKSKMGDLLGDKGPGFEKGAKGASKAGGAMKMLGSVGNVLGKLAAPLAIGKGVYDAVEGYNSADKNLGIQGRQATTGEKLSSAAGGALSGLTFGLISPETISKSIANATGAGPDSKATLDETKKDNETKAKLQVDQTKVTTTLDGTNKDLNKVMIATKNSIDALKTAIEDLTSVASIKDATGTAESKQKKLEDIYKRLGIGAEVPTGTAPSPGGGTAPSPGGGTAPSPGGGTAPSPGGGTAPRPSGNVQSSEAQLREAGLVLKKGDVQKAGAELDPRLIDIAKQVQASVPGFMQFTGFNDQFHAEKSPRSLHAKGKAFDFVVGKKPSKEEGAKIVELMKSLGVDYGIDEYNNPSAQATGGHFHGQLKAYDGGVFEGPTAGYDVELHGREAVVPLPNPDSMITVSDKNSAEKNPLNTAMADSISSSGSSESSEMMSIFMEEFKEFMAMKIDELKDVMEEGNGISDKILTYSKV